MAEPLTKQLTKLTLAETYKIDESMSKRTEDLEFLKREITQVSKKAIVVEIGCGNGRIPYAIGEDVCSKWVGIDMSVHMLDMACPKKPTPWLTLIHGNALEETVWERVTMATGRAMTDIILIPYSTLFLIPHEHQRSLLRRCHIILNPGGRLIIECFIQQHGTGTFTRSKRVGDYDRISRYTVDSQKQTTFIERFYFAPNTDEKLFYVEEFLYWLNPEQLRSTCVKAGFHTPFLLMNDDISRVPKGNFAIRAAW